jgi:hypothetical protein
MVQRKKRRMNGAGASASVLSSIEVVPLDQLKLDPENARRHSEANRAAVAASLRRFGQRQALVVRRSDNVVIAGNLRLECMRDLGWMSAGVVYVDDGRIESIADALADNRTAELADWNDRQLMILLDEIRSEEWDVVELGWIDPHSTDKAVDMAGRLSLDFGLPPFSVLDARQGYWQERKHLWIALGIRSERGRSSTDLTGLKRPKELLSKMRAGTKAL